MNDQVGLDQKDIDDLLADAKKELSGLAAPEAETTEPVTSIPEEVIALSPEVEAPETGLPPKNKRLFLLNTLKEHIHKKQLLLIIGLFLLVIAGSAFGGYKMGQHKNESQDPLEQIVKQGITVEEKSFVIYAGFGDEKIVKAFLETGMSVDALRPSDGWSPLMAAAFYKKTAVVKYLLEKDASVNLQDKYGKTALMQAAAMGAEDIVSLLLTYGANPNLQDQNGRTALMEAYSKKQAKIAELLKAAGADTTIQPIKVSANPTIPPVKAQKLPTTEVQSSLVEENRLTVGKAGFVQIGMPLADVQKKYPALSLSQKYINGSKKPIATVYLNGPNNPSLELELSNSSLKLVSTISTADDQFSTDKQISIKSTVGDIRNQYPTTDIRVIDNIPYLTVKSIKMLFQLDITDEAILKDWLTTGDPNSIPADVKIKRIIIY